MNTEKLSNIALLLEGLDIPSTAYSIAEKRYKDLGEFFASDKAKSTAFDPHIYSQGSFRIGTVVRPLGEKDEFDLDVGCRLRTAVTKGTHSQKYLKDLIGDDLQHYKKERGVEKRLEEKRRCWRLSYKDELAFHMDVVPSIPEEQNRRIELREAIVASGAERTLAERVAGHLGAITDNEKSNYPVVSPDWRVSNSEGYALWFESRMMLARELMENRAVVAKTKIDELPARDWNSPLQQAIRILKRHRDQMYSDNGDAKPISVIITTLAARAYRGETEVESALATILEGMDKMLGPPGLRVPNPVNPKEDFADKWADPKHAHLDLEGNFHAWLDEARRDFANLQQANSELLLELADARFGTPLHRDRVLEIRGSSQPKRKPDEIKSVAAQPWVHR